MVSKSGLIRCSNVTASVSSKSNLQERFEPAAAGGRRVLVDTVILRVYKFGTGLRTPIVA
jgi:hypothetical protein